MKLRAVKSMTFDDNRDMRCDVDDFFMQSVIYRVSQKGSWRYEQQRAILSGVYRRIVLASP